MKKIINLLSFIIFSISLSNNLFAVSDSSIVKALQSLSEDINVISDNIKKLALYGISEDIKQRYDVQTIRNIIESEIKQNERFILINRDSIGDTLEELNLSMTGLVDFNSVKEAGKISGVDAFVFVYPVVSGSWNKRITVMVKVIDVKTGSVIFVEEYQYEEMSLLSLAIGLKISAYAGNTLDAAFICDNPVRPDWSVTENLSQYINIDLAGGFHFEKINTSLIAGLNMTIFESPKSGIDLPEESEYVNDVLYESVVPFGLEGGQGLTFFGGANFPVSALFSDKYELIRGRLAYGFGILQLGSHSELHVDADIGDGLGVEIYEYQTGLMIFHVIKLGFDFKLAGSINLLLDFDYFTGGSSQSGTGLGGHYLYTMTPGLRLSAGLSYGLF